MNKTPKISYYYCCEVNKRRVVYSELNSCVLIYPNYWYIEYNSGSKRK